MVIPFVIIGVILVVVIILAVLSRQKQDTAWRQLAS